MAAEETGSNISKYYYGVDGIAFSDISGEYYLKNIHGDITGTIDSNGAVQQNNSYDAFGNRLSSNSDPFGYCGEYMDSESGLIYLRNRYYDTATGTFITEDPIRDGLNWYAYCNGNPIMFVDPTGMYYLEKDSNGQVYAIIEAGDTLSGIAKAEVNDANAWRKINYNGDPGYLQVGERINITPIYNSQYPVSNVLKESNTNTVTRSGKLYGVYYETNLILPTDLSKIDKNDYIITYNPLFTVMVVSKDAVDDVKQLESDYISRITTAAIGGLKFDIKQVHSVAKSLGMTPKQTELFKREIEGLKRMAGKSNNTNFSYQELIEIGKEIIDLFK